MNQPDDLADYILKIVNKDDLSYQKIVERAEKKGHKITHSYISKIVSRAAQNISVGKLQALAAGLNRPEEEVFAVAHGEKLTDEKINDAMMNSLAFNYGKLTKRDKDAIAPLLRALQREIDERLDK